MLKSKIVIAVLVLALSSAWTVDAKETQIQRLEKMVGYKHVKENLTLRQIRHRKGELIERIVWKVTSKKGKGRIIKTGKYISFPKRYHYNKGDIIVTYVTYNPRTKYVDDVIDRWDWNLTQNPVIRR